MFKHFTDRARTVMALAKEEAIRLNHNYIAPEHILLGMVKEGAGVGANALKFLGVDLGTVRREVEKLVESGPEAVIMAKLPQTLGAKRVLEYAIAESGRLNHNFVGTEHLLLGLLHEDQATPVEVLARIGVTQEAARREVLDLLGAETENESCSAGDVATLKRTRPMLRELGALEHQLYGRDFLLTWDQSLADLKTVLLTAGILEEFHRGKIATRVFDSGLAVSIFRDQSTRTRFSFASAANLLGLGVQELDEKKSQIAHGETVRETANMISFLTEVIGIRDDLFLGEGHKYMAEVAAAVEEGHRAGVLAQRPAVINLQCDLDHPTQSLADLLHLQQTFGSLEALRGKKLAMTWAYSPSYGKPLSVPQGIISLMTRFGMNVALAHPEGYDLVPETLENAAKFAAESGGACTHTHDMAEAFRDADIVYPKSWAPLRVMQERTRLLKASDTPGLEALEKECLAQNAHHKDWECNEKLMSLTKLDRQAAQGSTAQACRDGKALYMHCLPADISGVRCEAGEVAASVFERYRLTTYREAAHKPFIIAAMILLTRVEDPAAVLRNLTDDPRPRRPD